MHSYVYMWIIKEIPNESASIVDFPFFKLTVAFYAFCIVVIVVTPNCMPFMYYIYMYVHAYVWTAIY